MRPAVSPAPTSGGRDRVPALGEREASAAVEPKPDALPSRRRGQRRDAVQPAVVELELEPDAVLERQARVTTRAAQRAGWIEHARGRAASAARPSPSSQRAVVAEEPGDVGARRLLQQLARRSASPTSSPSIRISSRSASAHASARSWTTTSVARVSRAQRRDGVLEQRWRGPRRRARRTARRAAGRRARPRAPGRGGRAGARRPTAPRPGGRRGARPRSLAAPSRARLCALGRGTPHQASASITFASTVRRARSGDCSAIATRPWRSTVPSAGSAARRPARRAACSCRRRWGRAARPPRRGAARGRRRATTSRSPRRTRHVLARAAAYLGRGAARSRRRPEAHADAAAPAAGAGRARPISTRISAISTIPIASRVGVVGGVGLVQRRAGERLVVAVDVAADDHDRRRPRTATCRAPRSPRRSRRSAPRAAASGRELPPAGAEQPRLRRAGPGGSPWIAAALSATTYGSARTSGR